MALLRFRLQTIGSYLSFGFLVCLSLILNLDLALFILGSVFELPVFPPCVYVPDDPL